jgi:protein gp37
MADGTHIEWTDATWNVITGCSVVSPGCTNCYAMRLAGTRLRNHPTRNGLTTDSKAGPVWNGQVRFNESMLEQPLRWARPRKIFVCAHADLFHENVPDEWIDRVFAVMALCPQHVFQVLTKRPKRMREYLSDKGLSARLGAQCIWTYNTTSIAVVPGRKLLAALGNRETEGEPEFVPMPLPNVWFGVSVEDQTRADERIPDLLATPAAVRWLSMEPLLGPVDLTSIRAPREPDEPADSLNLDWHFDCLTTGDYYWFDGENGQPGDSGDGPYRENRIDWVVLGGESGPGSRPLRPDWAKAVRDQCASATIDGDEAPVPFHFKQWGDWSWVERFEGVPESLTAYRAGKKAAGRLLDGVQHDGMPAHG